MKLNNFVLYSLSSSIALAVPQVNLPSLLVGAVSSVPTASTDPLAVNPTNSESATLPTGTNAPVAQPLVVDPNNPSPYGPPSPPYGQPSSPPYGQPPSPPYGQPPSPPYGQPPSPPYGQPPSPPNYPPCHPNCNPTPPPYPPCYPNCGPSTPPAYNDVIEPDVISEYSVSTGAIDYDTGYGYIFKDGSSSDITTLLTFTYPQEAQGQTCTFHLYLDPSDAIASGSQYVDVFSSLAPAPGPETSWPPGNQRNNQLGRLLISMPGDATYVDGFPQYAASYPCPDPGTIEGWELVGTNDNIEIGWIQGANVGGATVGAYITY